MKGEENFPSVNICSRNQECYKPVFKKGREIERGGGKE